VRSIIQVVDAVVIVDNLSDDRTPQIIDTLVKAYPDKIAAYSYAHRILRVGKENEEAAASTKRFFGSWS
jgi:glycosyltransferase involved in cell wall biosynthesis